MPLVEDLCAGLFVALSLVGAGVSTDDSLVKDTPGVEWCVAFERGDGEVGGFERYSA